MYPDAASFLSEEREAWRPYEALAGLSDDRLSRPLEGAHGWSGRDLMAHLIFWHERNVVVARELAVAETSASHARYEEEWNSRGGDAINDDVRASWAALPMAEVRKRFQTVFEELRGLLAEVPESRWATTPEYSTVFPGETIDHYKEHAADLAAVLATAG